MEEPSNSLFPEAPYDPNVLQTFQQGASSQAPPYAAGPSSSALPQQAQDISALLSSPQLAPWLNTLQTVIQPWLTIQPLLAIQHLLAQDLSSELRTQLGNILSTSMPSSSIQQQQRQTPQSDAVNSFTSRSDTTAPNPASLKYEYEEESTTTAQNYPRRNGSLSSIPASDDETRRTSGTGLASKRKHESTGKAPATQLNKGFFFLDGAPSDFYIDMSVKSRKELINIIKVCFSPSLLISHGPEYMSEKWRKHCECDE